MYVVVNLQNEFTISRYFWVFEDFNYIKVNLVLISVTLWFSECDSNLRWECHLKLSSEYIEKYS